MIAGISDVDTQTKRYLGSTETAESERPFSSPSSVSGYDLLAKENAHGQRALIAALDLTERGR